MRGVVGDALRCRRGEKKSSTSHLYTTPVEPSLLQIRPRGFLWANKFSTNNILVFQGVY
jgi:hypothetical protein